jgi:hypothetical protein
MIPFRYPEDRLARRQTPRHFSDYRRYKPYLREEFNRQCVYCRMPDGLRGQDMFGVDHYRPVSLFPALLCEYGNLFYSCNSCNRLKRDFWPAEHELAEGLFLPNPCDHTMSEHLQYSGAWVMPESGAGELAVELLLLNDDSVVGYREFVLRSIERCLTKEQALLETLLHLESRLVETQGPQLAELRLDIAGLQVDLAAVQADLERLTAQNLAGEWSL